MENNKRNQELEPALFQLALEIQAKLGGNYKNIFFTSDRMDAEQMIKNITENVRRTYPGYSMEQLIETNINLSKNIKNVKNEIGILEEEKNTYKKKLEALKKENENLLHIQDSLLQRLEKRVKNNRDDINAEEVKYLYENGMSVSELAEKFQTNRQTIYNRLHKP